MYVISHKHSSRTKTSQTKTNNRAALKEEQNEIATHCWPDKKAKTTQHRGDIDMLSYLSHPWKAGDDCLDHDSETVLILQRAVPLIAVLSLCEEPVTKEHDRIYIPNILSS